MKEGIRKEEGGILIIPPVVPSLPPPSCPPPDTLLSPFSRVLCVACRPLVTLRCLLPRDFLVAEVPPPPIQQLAGYAPFTQIMSPVFNFSLFEPSPGEGSSRKAFVAWPPSTLPLLRPAFLPTHSEPLPYPPLFSVLRCPRKLCVN